MPLFSVSRNSNAMTDRPNRFIHAKTCRPMPASMTMAVFRQTRRREALPWSLLRKLQWMIRVARFLLEHRTSRIFATRCPWLLGICMPSRSAGRRVTGDWILACSSRIHSNYMWCCSQRRGSESCRSTSHRKLAFDVLPPNFPNPCMVVRPQKDIQRAADAMSHRMLLPDPPNPYVVARPEKSVQSHFRQHSHGF